MIFNHMMKHRIPTYHVPGPSFYFLSKIKWLEDNIGEKHVDWSYQSSLDSDYFLFLREEDKVKFILKWM